MSDILSRLEQTIRMRKSANLQTSYVAQLLDKGIGKAGEKFIEEANELLEASAAGDRTHIVYETADMLFHMLVLLAAHNIPFDEVTQELARREGVSGLEEKASR